MFLSGIADEAGPTLEMQIRAHQELGWRHIELRTVDGTNITDVDDATFDHVAERLRNAGLTVSCIASQIANWARPIDTEFEVDLDELHRAIPRMHHLGTRLIRCMSYPNSDPPLSETDWRARVVQRIKQLTEIAEQGGVILVHENCHGWAGQGARQANDLLAEVDSPHLKVVFDTGNPICEGQDVWELYRELRHHIEYVHIKDYKPHGAGDSEEGVVACFPGEGRGYVSEITSDLLRNGYDGGFSIEPHIDSVIHLDRKAFDPDLAYRRYIEYGRRFAESVLARDVRPGKAQSSSDDASPRQL